MLPVFTPLAVLYVSRFLLVDFLPLLTLLIFSELAHSFPHNYFSFLILFMFLQGGLAFASKIAHLKHQELRKLAADLPLRTIEAKVTQELFRNSGNGLHITARSFACPRTRFQFLFI